MENDEIDEFEKTSDYNIFISLFLASRVPSLNNGLDLTGRLHKQRMSGRKPVLVLLLGILESPSLIRTISHLYNIKKKQNKHTSEILLMRNNYTSQIRLVRVGGVAKSSGLGNSLTSLLQQLVLLTIICNPNKYLIRSLIIQTGHPSEPLGSNLLVVKLMVPSSIFHPSMTS